MLNDPHVEALIYAIEHNRSVSYERATPMEVERQGFSLKVEAERVRFEMKEHYPSEGEAQAAVQPFIDQWEFNETLITGPGQFALRFDHSEIEDRHPTLGVIALSAQPVGFNVTVSMPTVTVSRQYPQPPSEVAMDIHDPDVETMRYRYLLYREGADRLPSMTYFCCEVFTKRLSKGTKDAADKHKISRELIRRVHKLSSIKGGAQGRHASAIDHPLAQCEVRLLEKAIVAMIIRAAKVAGDPNQPMEFIDLGNLLEVAP